MSAPLAVAVRQVTVPGPLRCTQATMSEAAPTPLTSPSADRETVRLLTRSTIAITASGATMTWMLRLAIPAAQPMAAHATNHSHARAVCG